MKKYKQESALNTKNRRLHFETKAEADPGVVVGIIDRLNFHRYPDMRILNESSNLKFVNKQLIKNQFHIALLTSTFLNSIITGKIVSGAILKPCGLLRGRWVSK